MQDYVKNERIYEYNKKHGLPQAWQHHIDYSYENASLFAVIQRWGSKLSDSIFRSDQNRRRLEDDEV